LGVYRELVYKRFVLIGIPSSIPGFDPVIAPIKNFIHCTITVREGDGIVEAVFGIYLCKFLAVNTVSGSAPFAVIGQLEWMI